MKLPSMLASFILLLTCTVSAWCAEKPAAPASAPADEVFVDLPLGDEGARIVGIRGPDQDPSAVWKTLSPGTVRHDRVFSLRIELRVPQEPAVVLTSTLMRTYDISGKRTEITMLASLTETDSVTLGIAEGSGLMIWHIGVRSPLSWFASVPRGETPAAVPYPLQRAAKMKLNRTNEGVLRYEIIHHHAYHSAYEQTGPDNLKFKLIREWVEKKE